MELPLLQVVAANLLLLRAAQATALPQDKEEPSAPENLSTLVVSIPDTAAPSPPPPATPTTLDVPTVANVATLSTLVISVAPPPPPAATPATVPPPTAPYATIPMASKSPLPPPPNPGKPTWECFYRKKILWNEYHLMGRNWNKTSDDVHHACSRSDLLTDWSWFEGQDVYGAQLFYADFKLPIKTAKRLERNLDEQFILPYSATFPDLTHMKCTSHKVHHPPGPYDPPRPLMVGPGPGEE